jgi:hypothetical protein
MHDQEGGKEKVRRGRSSRGASLGTKGAAQGERAGEPEDGAETGAGEPWDGNGFTGGGGTDKVGNLEPQPHQSFLLRLATVHALKAAMAVAGSSSWNECGRGQLAFEHLLLAQAKQGQGRVNWSEGGGFLEGAADGGAPLGGFAAVGDGVGR